MGIGVWGITFYERHAYVLDEYCLNRSTHTRHLAIESTFKGAYEIAMDMHYSYALGNGCNYERGVAGVVCF